jgi:hypothetical protein
MIFSFVARGFVNVFFKISGGCRGLAWLRVDSELAWQLIWMSGKIELFDDLVYTPFDSSVLEYRYCCG